jgi:hypothetical protein
MPKKTTSAKSNPLEKYFRQPKIYLKLPSGGTFYPEGALDLPENGEVPVYPMTAKDELTFKTPDALINGQATVEVIKSCVPNIKDPWQMPSIDMDALLIGIRLATYGEQMTLSVKVPVTGADRDMEVDLRVLLDKLIVAKYDDTLFHDNMEIKVKPLSYSEYTKNSLKTFEEQKIYSLVNDKTIPDEEKMDMFSKSFIRLTQLTVDMVAGSIISIKVDGETVTDSKMINEFINKAEKEFYQSVLDHITKQRDEFAIKPFTATTTEDEQAKGAPKEFDVPVTFDSSNFFA